MKIDVPGGSLNYDEAGSGSPVVLLHGGAMDLRMWDPQMDALSAGHRVIRFDARGHGESSTPTAPFRQCDDIAMFLEALELDNATLVGLSMGGGAAVDAALEHPQHIGAVVSIGAGASASYFTDPWMVHLQRTLMQRQMSMDADGWVRGFLKMGLIGPYRRTTDVPGEILKKCAEMAMHTVASHAKPDAVPPTPVEDAWVRLGDIKIPLLTVIGSHDAPDHFAMVERLAAGVDGSTSRIIEDAAHMPNLERPGDFNAVLLEFLKG